MATARSTALPLDDYASGVYNLGPVNLADNIIGLGLGLQRCTTATPTIWPNETTTFQAALEVSFDGGVTWEPAGGFGGQGGIYVSKGVEQPESFNFVNLRPGAGRRLRATVTIAGGPMRTKGDLLLTS